MFDETFIGRSVTQEWEYTWRDIALYNLAIGADSNANPEELSYVFEDGLKALPSFATMPIGATFNAEPNTHDLYLPTSGVPEWPRTGVLHMDHELQIVKPLDPHGGKLRTTKTIVGVYDRGPGKGAKVDFDIVSRNEQGEVVCINKMGAFNRDLGGFGGKLPPKSDVAIPDRTPDYLIAGRADTRANQLYRLTGDTFRLHIDPSYAKKSGFEKPIMHGLCNFGIANRSLVNTCVPGQPERVTRFGCQFRHVSYAGYRYMVHAWADGDNRVVFRMADKENGNVVLDRGFMEWK